MQQYIKEQSEKGVTHIKISEELTQFPDFLFDHAETLEILDLSNNKLHFLPKSIEKFTRLKVLFCTNNRFENFPTEISKCPELEMISFKSNGMKIISEDAFPKKLRWLILTDNQIKKIPESIGDAIFLKKCALAGNQITNIPASIQNCNELELLRISANQLNAFPEVLLKLPKLAWLGFSGNPFVKKSTEELATPFYDWNDFELDKLLGEGASGVISKAYWKSKKQWVAIKVFKGDVTSDGYPEDELHACLTTGKHENLVPLLGQIQNHPENKSGIIMELIDPSYKNLGNPPSLTSCSRDVFPENLNLSFLQAVTILKCVASATLHLHQNGILHGDLYAHNTLFNENGHAYFGDFGAATFYDTNQSYSKTIEKIDVRSFGYFIEDILSQTQNETLNSRSELELLMQDCLNEVVEMRPDFKYITSRLEGI